MTPLQDTRNTLTARACVKPPPIKTVLCDLRALEAAILKLFPDTSRCSAPTRDYQVLICVPYRVVREVALERHEGAHGRLLTHISRCLRCSRTSTPGATADLLSSALRYTVGQANWHPALAQFPFDRKGYSMYTVGGPHSAIRTALPLRFGSQPKLEVSLMGERTAKKVNAQTIRHRRQAAQTRPSPLSQPPVSQRLAPQASALAFFLSASKWHVDAAKNGFRSSLVTSYPSTTSVNAFRRISPPLQQSTISSPIAVS